MEKRRNDKGFSLVELIVVVAIMAVLMTVLAPQLLKYVEEARAQKDESAAGEFLHAIEIAVTDEAIYSGLGLSSTNTTITVKCPDNAAYTDGTEALRKELTAALGSKIDFTSSTHGGQTYEVTIKYDDTTKALSFTGEWKNASTPTT